MADAVRSANRGVSWSRVGTRQLLNWAAIASTILSSAAQRGVAAAQSTADGAGAGTSIVRVDATPGHVINSFDPDSALGGSIDVLSHDGINKVYSPRIIQESLSAGWGPISYRNNSELRMAAWHWTENGRWRPGPQERLLYRQYGAQGTCALHFVLCTTAPWVLDERRPAYHGSEP